MLKPVNSFDLNPNENLWQKFENSVSVKAHFAKEDQFIHSGKAVIILAVILKNIALYSEMQFCALSFLTEFPTILDFIEQWAY